MGFFNCPPFQRIFGEVYDVDDAMLKELDILEHHPQGYTRKVFQFELVPENESSALKESDTKNSQRIIECQGYTLSDFAENLLELPLIENFHDKGKFNLEGYSRDYESVNDFWERLKTN